MHFILVTGMSGAGRSGALKRLEDIGFFCVDNLPPAMIYDFARLCHEKQPHIEKVAVVVDVRAGGMLEEIYEAIDDVKKIDGIHFEILYLSASVETLIRRFQKTRRLHPVNPGNTLNGIETERKKLKMLYDMANTVIDTSDYTDKQLGEAIENIFGDHGHGLIINIITFGYKHGMPLDADMVFDMRFIPNPYYIEEMRAKTGMDEQVRKYVMSFSRTQAFINSVYKLVKQLAPYYLEQDKRNLVIAIGCTGGRHRSVVVAQELYIMLKEDQMNVTIQHRNMELM